VAAFDGTGFALRFGGWVAGMRHAEGFL